MAQTRMMAVGAINIGRLWYVSEVQPPAFADGLRVEYEQKGRVTSDWKMFRPSSWKGGFAID